MTGIPAFVPLYALLFCSLTLLSNLEGKERAVLDNDPPRSRAERATNTPAKIACELSPWGQWSSCHPCKGLRHRSRDIVRFGQFAGRTCTDILSTEEPCPLSGNCEVPTVNCGNNFQCENGRCIQRRLKCNDDNDCGDYSDEDDCESYRSPCRRALEPLEIGDTAGSGMNIFGMEPRKSPFNNKFYNGQCDSAYDGNRRTYFRIPWNIAFFTYQTQARQAFTTEVYETSSEVVTKIMEETTNNFNVGFSLTTKSNLLESKAGVGFNLNKSQNLEKLLSHNQSQTNEYFRVKGQIQLAKFHMRTSRYMLNEDFIIDLKDLPTEYDKGVYFKFLENYGTHYSASGTLGGDYQMVYVLDKSEMDQERITSEQVKRCLGFDANFNIQQSMSEDPGSTNVGGGLNINTDSCKKITNSNYTSQTEKPIIKDVLSFVNGGDTVFLTKLNVLLSEKTQPLDISVYTDWAGSLIHAAALVRQQLKPVYSLVPPTMRDALVIRQNLERATSDYEAEYSVCKCAPCMNGGTLIQLDGQCQCLCPMMFQGLACETSKPQNKGKAGYTNGQWSCWSEWSSCTNKQQVRSRQCVGTQGGGEPCPGENQGTRHC
ncbi:complement component C9 isoform X1 [Stegostoma tigrinum]|uniref:complement component C9 isoform X1 n=1 Tax=Stegostoma tigrinum TaxID=3053191 RepID=UPI002870A392|nr:complement component C9 isoform X1 [Stegostoma tigrinum]